jgi:hypothetical protein
VGAGLRRAAREPAQDGTRRPGAACGAAREGQRTACEAVREEEHCAGVLRSRADVGGGGVLAYGRARRRRSRWYCCCVRLVAQPSSGWSLCSGRKRA